MQRTEGNADVADDAHHSVRRFQDNTLAPRCWVRFRCPECEGEIVLDAYDGAPRHRHDKEVGEGAERRIVYYLVNMEAMTVVREAPWPGHRPSHVGGHAPQVDQVAPAKVVDPLGT